MEAILYSSVLRHSPTLPRSVGVISPRQLQMGTQIAPVRVGMGIGMGSLVSLAEHSRPERPAWETVSLLFARILFPDCQDILAFTPIQVQNLQLLTEQVLRGT